MYVFFVCMLFVPLPQSLPMGGRCFVIVCFFILVSSPLPPSEEGAGGWRKTPQATAGGTPAPREKISPKQCGRNARSGGMK
jgi:hypothetical protein